MPAGVDYGNLPAWIGLLLTLGGLAWGSYVYFANRMSNRRADALGIVCYYNRAASQIVVKNASKRVVFQVNAFWADPVTLVGAPCQILEAGGSYGLPAELDGARSDVVVVQFTDTFGQRWQRSSDHRITRIR